MEIVPEQPYDRASLTCLAAHVQNLLQPASRTQQFFSNVIYQELIKLLGDKAPVRKHSGHRELVWSAKTDSIMVSKTLFCFPSVPVFSAKTQAFESWTPALVGISPNRSPKWPLKSESSLYLSRTGEYVLTQPPFDFFIYVLKLKLFLFKNKT